MNPEIYKRDPNFPQYRIYPDGTVYNERNHHRAIKSPILMFNDKGGFRFTKNQLIQKYWPEGYQKPKPKPTPKKGPKRKYTPRLLRRIKRYMGKYGFSKTLKRFNIPVGSINHVMDLINPKAKISKGNSDVRPIKIVIKKVIVHIKP